MMQQRRKLYMRHERHMTIEGIQLLWLRQSDSINSDYSDNEKKGNGNGSNRNVSGNLGDVVAEQMLTMHVKQ